MIEVYGIKNCDSVKKALKFFKLHALEYELFDFKTQKITPEQIEMWLEKTDITTLFNARSTTYRNLKLKEMHLDDTAKVKWLSQENLLIKRPVVIYKEHLLVGYDEEKYKRIFL